MTSPVPRKVEDLVCRKIFSDMAALSWEGLGHTARSEQYERWVSSADVGDRLSLYMPVERVRVWIKDGPVKEYPRARWGRAVRKPRTGVVGSGRGRAASPRCQLGAGRGIAQGQTPASPCAVASAGVR